jgi:ABC-type nitrate/sulfonate/bicarbonate transport system substrate-binding protein
MRISSGQFSMKKFIYMSFLSLLWSINSVYANDHINMITFAGATNLPVWVAQDEGYFARENLDVDTKITSGSVEQVKELMAGHYQIMTSAFDNIVAYANGEGDIRLEGTYDLISVMGVHAGMNSLMTVPSVARYEDIRGKAVAVDAVRSGYAMVMYKILEKHGLKRDVDYSMVAVGSTTERMKAMEDGRAVAAMVAAPTDLEAQARGYHLLADAAAEIGPYQGSAYVVRRSWADTHPQIMAAYIRAIVAATDAIFASPDMAQRVMQARVKTLTPQAAQEIYGRLIGSGGLNAHARIDDAAIKAVLDLRREGGLIHTAMDLARYRDTSYYQRAITH